MYAIVEIAGQQLKVAENQQLIVNRLEAGEGQSIDFDKVLLVEKNGKVKVGSPTVSGAVISAKVIGHVRGDKVLVFKKKRRKGYQTLNGHRQPYTRIQIDKIKA